MWSDDQKASGAAVNESVLSRAPGRCTKGRMYHMIECLQGFHVGGPRNSQNFLASTLSSSSSHNEGNEAFENAQERGTLNRQCSRQSPAGGRCRAPVSAELTSCWIKTFQ